MHRITLEQKQMRQRIGRTATAITALAIIAWLLSTVQPIPAAQCQIDGYSPSGEHQIFNQC